MLNRKFKLDIPNDYLNLINNPKLSLKAKGLYLYLLSKADDYCINTKDIAIFNKDSPNYIFSAIRELESLGYIHTEYKGKDLYYTFYDTPQSELSVKFKQQETIKKNADNATKDYIKKYLTPNKHFKRSLSIDTLLSTLQNPEYTVDWDYIYDYITCQLTYNEFLNTEYWEIISIWKKIHSNFTCEICGEKFKLMSKLNIHHMTYANHGREHLQSVIDNELHCYCEDCHLDWHMKNNIIDIPE